MRYLCLAVLAACSPTIAQDPTTPDAPGAVVDPPVDPSYQPLADKIEAERVKLGAPGAAVLVIKDGNITFARGFGTKTAGGDPVQATTLFRIGSTTKMMTTTLLLQLVATGQVNLDDPVTKALPAFHLQPGADVATSITIRQLLSHSTGLYDYLEVDGPHDDASLNSYLTGAFGGIEFEMAPAGRMWNYSNPNFMLAGLTAEVVGGVPYRQAMHDKVWAPLGMDRTMFLPSEVLADGDYATGVGPDGGGAMQAWAPDAYDNAWGRPAGYAFSSVYDLGKFGQFLLDGNPAVLPDAQRHAMTSPQVDMQDAGSHDQYGFGLFVSDYVYLDDGWHPGVVVQHGGDINGFSCDLYTVPASHFVMAVLVSASDAHLNDSINFALATYADLPAAIPTPSEVYADGSTFPGLAGSYNDAFDVGRVVVTATTTAVTLSMPDLDAAKISYTAALEPLSKDNFLFTIEGYQDELTFIRDAAGKPAFIRNRAFVAKAGAAFASAIDPARLRARLRAPHPAPTARFRPARA